MRRIFAVLALVGATILSGSATADAATPTLVINPAGVLDATGRSVTLSGTLRCDPVPPVAGATERLMLKVVQQTPTSVAQAQREFDVSVLCTGAPVPYSFTIPTISTSPLVPGSATAQGLLHGSVGAVSYTTAIVLA